MAVDESMAAWLHVLERYRLIVSNDAQLLRQLSDLQRNIKLYVTNGEGSVECIESDIQLFASQHQDILINVVEQIVTELLEVVDLEIADLRLAKNTTGLTESARARASHHAGVVQEFITILREMSRK